MAKGGPKPAPPCDSQHVFCVRWTQFLHFFHPVLSVKVKHVVVGLLLLILVSLIWWRSESVSIVRVSDCQDSWQCFKDHTQGGRSVCLPTCPEGHFILPGMQECHKMLTCREMKSDQFKVKQGIGAGAVKAVFLASWNGLEVVLNTLAQPQYKEDFLHGLSMLQSSLQGHHHCVVTKLLGYCETVFVTEYHKLGDASRLFDILSQPQFQHLDTLSLRFSLCVDYSQIIAYFHLHHTGTRVFCDSNTLQATLQQFLITSSLCLVANDLDALPVVRRPGGSLHCGHRPIFGEFAAPEQRWLDPEIPYNETLLPGYNEKVDIWKIPDVCEHFLGHRSEAVKFHLFKVHRACKSEVPGQRPNASFVVSEYQRIQETLGLS